MKGNVVVALVVGAALGFVGGRMTARPESASPRGQVMRPFEKAGGESAAGVQRYRVPIGDSPVMGPPSAKVTIVEATDFQCPYCGKANEVVEQILASYGDSVRLVVKQNPLSFHAQAMGAARAALAAGAQGKYFEMHRKLFQNQGSLTRPDLERYAEELGLDLARFRQDLDGDALRARIVGEQRLVVSLGAAGTPSFFINGRKVVGALPYQSFKRIVDEEIAAAEQAIARGVPAEAVYEELTRSGAAPAIEMPVGPGGVEMRAPSQPPQGEPAEAPSAAPTYAAARVPAYSPAQGPKDAKVTIVAWSDFECPYCSKGADLMREVLQAYPSDVRFVFRNQPLGMHSQALPAAKAAMAAHRQGKFFPMHDKLFASQSQLSPEKYEEWARELGLDLARFKKDVASAEVEKQVRGDADEAAAIGAEATPTFFVNGRKVEGAIPFASMKRVVDEELARAEGLLAKGVKPAGLYEALVNKTPERPAVEPGDAPMRGSTAAPVKVFVFSDFQCPHCAAAADTLRKVESAYGNRVAIYFKQMPLPMHDKAQLAAEASLAAYAQGRFWEMHDRLFANQNALGREDLEKHAAAVGLDVADFKAALDSRRFRAKVQADLAEASAAGVSGTPSLLINGRLIVGAQSFDELRKIIDLELDRIP